MMVLKEKKEMDDCFKKAQKPWVKILNKVDKAKLDYHNACKAERSASNQERNATGDNAVSPEQVSWLDLISRIKDREWIGQFVTAIGNLSLYISQHLSIMLPHTFSSITPAKENEKCQFPREEAGRVSFFLYGRMYRMGYGNGDPIAGGGLGKLLACVLQHTHIEGEASAEGGGGRSLLFFCTFSGRRRRRSVWLVYFIFGVFFVIVVCLWLSFTLSTFLSGPQTAGARSTSQRGGATNQGEVRGRLAGDQFIQPQVHGGHARSVWQVPANGGPTTHFLQRSSLQYPQRIEYQSGSNVSLTCLVWAVLFIITITREIPMDGQCLGVAGDIGLNSIVDDRSLSILGSHLVSPGQFDTNNALGFIFLILFLFLCSVCRWFDVFRR